MKSKKIKTMNRLRPSPISYVGGFLLILVVFLLVGCSKPQVMEVSKLILEKDTTWSGTVLVNGDVYVPPGITLTIVPGTTVKFKRIDETSDQNLFDADSPYYPQAELIIRGRLIAKGTKEKQIVFTSVEPDARARDWGAINFLGSEGNVVEYSKIFCAYNGIHAHGSQVRIAHNEFVKNGVGISFKSEEETPGVPWFGKRSTVEIIDNLITRNKGGIGFRNSDARIAHNEITDNKFFGIFPKEDVNVLVEYNEITNNKKGVYLYQARGVRFVNNNIYDNRDYDIAVAEAQDYDVDATGNWLGSINKAKIDELIFDYNDDQELGRVTYEPFLKKKVEWRMGR